MLPDIDDLFLDGLDSVDMPDPLPPARAWHRENLVGPDALIAQARGSDPIRFNVLSLPAWLAIAERAGVPHIPAREIAAMSIDDFHAPETGETAATDAFEAEIVAALGPSEILRMEQVAPAEIKHEMSEGKPLGNGTFWSEPLGRQMVPLYEDRFYTTLLDLAPETIRAYARPKVTPVRQAGSFRGTEGAWPVEFRVFVFDGRITGISNYYPQIALDPKAWMPTARIALAMAQRMIDRMRCLRIGVGNHRLSPDAGDPSRRSDWVPDHWGPQDFTLDFIVTDPGSVPVFLEGGPAGLVAAHPCCFEPRAGNPAEILSGFAFADGREPLPLPPA